MSYLGGNYMGGIASPNAPYVTVGNTGLLSSERALTGTANQVIVTDDGANTTVTLSLPQSIATSSTVTFSVLNLGSSVHTISSTGTTVFNDSNADRDFRIESQNNGNMFMIDASADTIGIGRVGASTIHCAIERPNTSSNGAFPIVDMTGNTQTITGAADDLVTLRVYGWTVSAGTALTATNVSIIDVTGNPGVASSAIITNLQTIRCGVAATLASASGVTYTAGIRVPAHTVTLTGTTQMTASPAASCLNLGIITLTDTSSITVDNGAPLYIAGAPAQDGSVTLTASYAIWCDAGIARFDGSVLVGGTAIETGSTNTVSILNGTAPDAGVADTVILYSSDISAGNTEPSFYCEGTSVLATGQADVATSVRVKMRINGTEVTLLAV